MSGVSGRFRSGYRNGGYAQAQTKKGKSEGVAERLVMPTSLSKLDEKERSEIKMKNVRYQSHWIWLMIIVRSSFHNIYIVVMHDFF